MTDQNESEHSEQLEGDPVTFESLVTELWSHEHQVISIKRKLVDILKEDLKATEFDVIDPAPAPWEEDFVVNVAEGSGTTIEDKRKAKPAKPKAKPKAKRKSRPSGIRNVKEGSRSHEILLAMERVGPDCKAAEVLEETNGLAATANGLSSVRNYLLQLAKGDDPWVDRVGLGTYRMTARATELLATLAPATS